IRTLGGHRRFYAARSKRCSRGAPRNPRTNQTTAHNYMTELFGAAFVLFRRGFGHSGPVVELVLDDRLELGRAWQHAAGVLGQPLVVRDSVRYPGAGQRVPHGRAGLARAQQDPDRWGVDLGPAELVVDDRDVRAELSDVGGLERPDL